MSEKRFKSVIDEDTMSVMPYLVSDKEEECFYNLQGCVDLLNTMSDEIEEVEISIKLFEDDVQVKDKKIDEQQATITELAKKWRVLSQENMQLKDYIDIIFEDNTHICKYLDVEDVQFYCDKNKNYRNPSCLYEKCFDEENLIKIKDEIRRVLE